MSTRLRMFAAALLLQALSAPAGAGPAEYVGSDCGLVSSNDPTSAVEPNPDVQHAVIFAGPVAAADYAEAPGLIEVDVPGNVYQVNAAQNPGLASHITITCSVEVNGTSVWTSSSTGDGVAVLADAFTFKARPGDVVEVCFDVQWSNPDTTVTEFGWCYVAVEASGATATSFVAAPLPFFNLTLASVRV